MRSQLLPKLQAAVPPTPEEKSAAQTVAEAIAEAMTAPTAGAAPLASENITLQELEAWRGTNSSQQATLLREK